MTNLEERVLKILPRGQARSVLDCFLHYGGLREYTGFYCGSENDDDLILVPKLAEILGLDYKVTTEFIGRSVWFNVEIGERISSARNGAMRMGEDQGYPNCCIRNYLRTDNGNYYFELLSGKSKKEIRQNYLHLAYANYRPCRINCTSTKSTHAKHRDYMRANFPRIAQRIERTFLRHIAMKEI